MRREDGVVGYVVEAMPVRDRRWNWIRKWRNWT